MATRPTTYTNWTPSPNSTQVVQPTTTLRNSGYSAGQSPAAENINWIFNNLDTWIQFLDQASYSTGLASSIDPDIRLLNGGNWTFSVASRALAWDAPFNLSVPGLTDGQNQAAAGSATLGSGQVAYVMANVPLTAHGDTVAGSATVVNIDYPAGIVVGMSVKGANIPSTTVVSVAGSTVGLALPATATGTQSALVFSSSGALTVSVANITDVAPSANLILIARATPTQAIVGVNTGQFIVKDGEQKLLLDSGFLSTLSAPAGIALTARSPVYLATAGDTGRAVGSVYPVDSSAANGAIRGNFIGFVNVATAIGTTATVITDGVLSGYTGLIVGSIYYSDNTTPGGITTTRPTATNAYVVPVGMAISATQIDINPAQAASVSTVVSIAAWPNYIANTEAQLVTALSSATSGGGGILVIGSSFSLSTVYTIPTGVIVQGRKGAAVLTTTTLGGSASGFLLKSGSEVRDLNFAGTQTIGPCILMSGDKCVVRGCTFAMQTLSQGTCISVTGSANRLYNNLFLGVLASGTSPTGIQYVSGSRNLDDSSVFSA